MKYSHIFPKCFQPTLPPLILTSLPLFSCQFFLGHFQSTLPLFPLHIFLTAPYMFIPFSFTCGADYFPSSLHRQHYHYYFYQQLSARLSLSPDHVSIFWASNDVEGVLLSPPQSGQKFSTHIFFFIGQQRKRMKGKIPAAILRTPPT